MTGAKPKKREEKLTPQGPAVNFVLGAAAGTMFQADGFSRILAQCSSRIAAPRVDAGQCARAPFG
jgi:hypothetical protein